MKWSSSYDSAARPYETPEQIQDYIVANGRYPQQWNDDDVKAWFTGLRLVDDTNSTGSTPPTASPSSSSSPSGTKSSSNTGVIAGGVVGGVVGALLIAGLAWYVLRRRRRSPSTLPEQHSQPGYEKAELESKQRGPGEELSADSKDYGNANGQGRELSCKPVMEMEGSPAQYELPDKAKR